jgi:hypothetical protein
MLHLLFVPVIVAIVLVSVVVRLITLPFRMGRGYYRHHHWRGRRWGWDGYRNPYGPGLMTIVAVVLLERLFGGRRYY